MVDTLLMAGEGGSTHSPIKGASAEQLTVTDITDMSLRKSSSQSCESNQSIKVLHHQVDIHSWWVTHHKDFQAATEAAL